VGEVNLVDKVRERERRVRVKVGKVVIMVAWHGMFWMVWVLFTDL
jgi:hypothetical protein